MIDMDAALTFLAFVENRHSVWERRQAGLPQETWTDDPVLATRKFTSVYRVLDWGSQFVLTDLIDPALDPRDQLARLFLYRHTGRVEAWQYLDITLGRYPLVADLDDVLEIWTQYRGKLREVTGGPTTPGGKGHSGMMGERKLFTGAYMVFPQSDIPGTDKPTSVIELTKRMFDGDAAMMTDFLAAGSQAERFAALRRNKGVADFMSMQILTDWGYTPHAGADRENEFVVPGPGARKGAAELGLPAEEAIRWGVDSLRNTGTVRLGDRLPSWMDVQNCLCEFSKYVRFASKPLPTKPYKPAHPGLRGYVLPEHF